jgi:hypothetical protein
VGLSVPAPISSPHHYILALLIHLKFIFLHTCTFNMQSLCMSALYHQKGEAEANKTIDLNVPNQENQSSSISTLEVSSLPLFLR